MSVLSLVVWGKGISHFISPPFTFPGCYRFLCRVNPLFRSFSDGCQGIDYIRVLRSV